MKRKTKSGTAREVHKQEADVFIAALECHDQVQDENGPLKRGVTHVRKKEPKGKVKVSRKRFSAI